MPGEISSKYNIKYTFVNMVPQNKILLSIVWMDKQLLSEFQILTLEAKAPRDIKLTEASET